MRIDHVAVWTTDLDRLRSFYERYFAATAGQRYVSRNQPGFESYFLRFRDGGASLELMTIRELRPPGLPNAIGYAHLAIGLGSRAAVDAMVGRMRADGVAILSGPRLTGDGFYEAVVGDPDGNRVEITDQTGSESFDRPGRGSPVG